MSISQRLTLITLGCRDLAKSRAFYNALGWVESSASIDVVAFFQLETGITFVLIPRENLAADATVPPTGDGFRGFALSYNAPNAAGVDAVMAEAIKAGGTLVRPAQTVFWGGYSGYFADPDGNLWEVCYHPVFPLDDRGRLTLPPPVAKV